MESSRQQRTTDASAVKHRRAGVATASPETTVAPAVRIPAWGVTQTPGAPPMTPDNVLSLQRAVGNRTTARVMGRWVQRHPEGEELPQKNEQVAEIQEKAAADPAEGAAAAPEATAGAPEAAAAAPEETRTAEEETAQKGEATKAGTAFQKSQELTPSAMSLAGAQKILQGAFGGVKDIVPGSIVILADPAALVAKYDEVCIADGIKRPDGSAWKAGDKAKDNAAKGVVTQGFAWKGVSYVNGKTSLVTTTAHEVLHNNTAAGFRGKVGETFNEGITETLARRALKNAGVTVPAVTAYPKQVKFTGKLEALVGESEIVNAYFNGADTLITKYETLKGAGKWATLKAAAEALNETAFDTALAAAKA